LIVVSVLIFIVLLLYNFPYISVERALCNCTDAVLVNNRHEMILSLSFVLFAVF